MIFSVDKGINKLDSFKSFSYKNYTYYYSGIIWAFDKKEGEETIHYLAQSYAINNCIPFDKLFGSFHCVIIKPNGEIIFFTDNSNMHCFFISNTTIGTNFLEVIKESDIKDLDLESISEFLALGNVYFGKTLVENINISSCNKYYIYSNGTIYEIDKKIDGIDGQSVIKDVNKYFEQMAYSLSDLKLTLSLTGGYDSRMVFACLKNHVPLDLFISGDNIKEKDIIYSEEVATIAGNKFKVIETIKPEITLEYIENLFYYSQGIIPFVNDGFFRISDFILDRAKGYNCYLSGDGGVMHKDWWWLQDIPYYRRKKVDFDKFYYQRIRFSKENIPWGPSISEIGMNLDKRMIRKLTEFKKPLNTQTYDALYFNVNGKKTSMGYTIHSNHIPSYAPLWELELVKYSYNLPRRKRFFYRSIRTITTKASKEIARIRTNYGTTASSELVYITRDIFFQFVDYFKKAIRMLGRKFLNKNFFVGNSVTWSTESDIRKLSISQEAVDHLITIGIFKKNTKANELSFSILGRAIQIFLVYSFLNKS
jgi:hypothetical protein